MNKILTLFLLISTVSFSQKVTQDNIGNFNEVKVFHGLNVSLEKADQTSIIITGKNSEDVVIKNTNGTLKILMKLTEIFKTSDIKITLYYTDNLSIIDANEGAYIGSDETINRNNIELKVQEGAIIDLDLDVKFLKIRSVTGGQIYTSGIATNQDVDVTTGGSYKGYELKSEHVSVLASSGGVVQVNVSEFLDAKVRFGGTVLYKGNPEEVKSKKIIGGTIKSKD